MAEEAESAVVEVCVSGDSGTQELQTDQPLDPQWRAKEASNWPRDEKGRRLPNGAESKRVIPVINIHLTDWPLQGVLKDMLAAMRARLDEETTKEPIEVTRWRRLYNDNPAKFMQILANTQEEIRREEVWMGQVVKERDQLMDECRALKVEKAKWDEDRLKQELEIERLRSKLPSGVDEYEDDGAYRTGELVAKLRGEMVRTGG